MTAHRQSALLLHGLNDSDRRWILGRLDEDNRRVLAEHLAELETLGIPADPRFVQAVLPTSETQDPLRSASAAQMVAVLANEPLWLVRQVLALENWPWRQEFIARLTPGQQRLMTSPPPVLRGRVAERLRWHVSQRLGQVAVAETDSVSGLRTVSHLLRRVYRGVCRWF